MGFSPKHFGCFAPNACCQGVPTLLHRFLSPQTPLPNPSVLRGAQIGAATALANTRLLEYDLRCLPFHVFHLVPTICPISLSDVCNCTALCVGCRVLYVGCRLSCFGCQVS